MAWSNFPKKRKKKKAHPSEVTVTQVSSSTEVETGIYQIYTLCLETDGIVPIWDSPEYFMYLGWDEGDKHKGAVVLPDGRSAIWFRVLGQNIDDWSATFKSKDRQLAGVLFEDYPSHDTGGILLAKIADEVINAPEPSKEARGDHYSWSHRLDNSLKINAGSFGFKDKKVHIGDVTFPAIFEYKEDD